MQRGKSRSGFTLVETLVALAIFAVGSLGVLGMMAISLNENANGRQAAEATLLGNFKLEHLDNSGSSDTEYTSCGTLCWESYNSGTGTVQLSTSKATVQLENVVGQPGTSVRYQLTWSVTSAKNMNGGSMLHVTVYWPRDKTLQALDINDPGFLDCTTSTGVGSCHKVDFFSMHR